MMQQYITRNLKLLTILGMTISTKAKKLHCGRITWKLSRHRSILAQKRSKIIGNLSRLLLISNIKTTQD